MKKIHALSFLKKSLLEDTDHWNSVIENACDHNAWFIRKNIEQSIEAITNEMLEAEKLENWIGNYNLNATENPKKIGLIMAGNLPLVGFADWLSVFMSGNIALVKCSDKDNILFPALMNKLNEIDSESENKTQIIERLKDYDAVIATGSNNSSIYFENYFKHVPHIIRKNRTSVAVLDGTESDEVILKIGNDIHAYFGLGCRNVSKIYLPVGYDVKKLLAVWETQQDNINFNKYKNNFDYNLSLYLLNKIPFYTDNSLILIEDKSLFSRISCIHFEFYDYKDSLIDSLTQTLDDIQCIVSERPLANLKVTSPGETQHPSLMDYADNVDTMQFLLNL